MATFISYKKNISGTEYEHFINLEEVFRISIVQNDLIRTIHLTSSDNEFISLPLDENSPDTTKILSWLDKNRLGKL